MANDALTAYRTDVDAGKDALLLCDTTEITDALNHRIHHDTIDPDRSRIAARRLDDDARAAFTGDYLREHITYGYAVTVHSPKASPPTQLTLSSAKTPPVQCFTSRSHVVANPTRPTSISAWWVRLTTSTASAKTSTRRRGSNRDAAHLLRDIIATHDERARTAHDVSAATEREHLPESVGSLVDRRTKATERRRRDYLNWHEQTQTVTSDNERWREQQVSRTSSPDYGIEL